MQFQQEFGRRIIDRNYCRKTTGRNDSRKTLEMRKTIELIKQKCKTGSTNFSRKTQNKRRTDTNNKENWYKTEKQNNRKLAIQILHCTEMVTKT